LHIGIKHYVRTWIIKLSWNRHQMGLYNNLDVLGVSQVWTWIDNNFIYSNYYERWIWALNVHITKFYLNWENYWINSHQEVVIVSSLQARGVVPLENTLWCITFTIHEQHKTLKHIFFRAFIKLDICISKKHNFFKYIYIYTYTNRTFSKKKNKALDINKMLGRYHIFGIST
jgi:hypothetical protein